MQIESEIKNIEIKVKNPKDYQKCEAYKRGLCTYDITKNELTTKVNVSPQQKCWRMVYWNGVVKDLFESEGVTHTIGHLFCGTKEECMSKIKELGLKYTPPDDEGLIDKY